MSDSRRLRPLAARAPRAPSARALGSCTSSASTTTPGWWRRGSGETQTDDVRAPQPQAQDPGAARRRLHAHRERRDRHLSRLDLRSAPAAWCPPPAGRDAGALRRGLLLRDDGARRRTRSTWCVAIVTWRELYGEAPTAVAEAFAGFDRQVATVERALRGRPALPARRHLHRRRHPARDLSAVGGVLRSRAGGGSCRPIRAACSPGPPARGRRRSTTRSCPTDRRESERYDVAMCRRHPHPPRLRPTRHRRRDPRRARSSTCAR